MNISFKIGLIVIALLSVACASVPSDQIGENEVIIEPTMNIDATIQAKLQILQQELDAQAKQQSVSNKIVASEPTMNVPKTGKISVNVEPSGSGSVESSIAFDDDGVPIGTYTAQPASGYVFDQWTGDFAPTLVEVWSNNATDDTIRKAPGGMVADVSGNLYIVDSDANRVQVYDFNGAYIFSWGSEGTGPGEFQNPTDIVIDEEQRVFVADTGNKRVQVFNAVGQYITSIGDPNVDSIKLQEPIAVSVDEFGFLYIADKGTGSINKFSTSGENSVIKLSMKKDKSITASFLTEAQAKQKALDEAGIVPTPTVSPTQTPWIKYIQVTPTAPLSTATPVVACTGSTGGLKCQCIGGRWKNCTQ
tara:strand:- start:4460 stop:5545 length:1086 start_codon:yes stop_codon:yes gene_type:complete